MTAKPEPAGSFTSAPHAYASTGSALRPGELEALREATKAPGYCGLDNRFVRGLLAEIDRLRAPPPVTLDDLLT